MLPDEPREAGRALDAGHLLLVRGGQLATIRAALEHLGATVDILPIATSGPFDPAPSSERIHIGQLVIDPGGHDVWLAGARVECTPTEFALLLHLAERPGQVLSRRQLLARLRGSADYLTPRTVDSHIANLRRKLDPRDGTAPLVVTVYGVGYKLRAERPRFGAVR